MGTSPGWWKEKRNILWSCTESFCATRPSWGSHCPPEGQTLAFIQYDPHGHLFWTGHLIQVWTGFKIFCDLVNNIPRIICSVNTKLLWYHWKHTVKQLLTEQLFCLLSVLLIPVFTFILRLWLLGCLELPLSDLDFCFSHTERRKSIKRSEVRQMPSLPRGGRDELAREEQVSSRRVSHTPLITWPENDHTQCWEWCHKACESVVGSLPHHTHAFIAFRTCNHNSQECCVSLDFTSSVWVMIIDILFTEYVMR